MFKLLVLLTVFAVLGVNSSPTVLYARPVVVRGVKNAEQPRPGSGNAGAKSFSPLPGTKNLAERIQIEPARLRGTENLAEKAIPEAVILRSFKNHERL